MRNSDQMTIADGEDHSTLQTSNKIDESDLCLSSVSFQGGIFSTWRFATLKIISSQMFDDFFICEISSKNCIFNEFTTERNIWSTKNICHWFRNVYVFFFRRNKLKLFTQLLKNGVNNEVTYANGSEKPLETLPYLETILFIKHTKCGRR